MSLVAVGGLCLKCIGEIGGRSGMKMCARMFARKRPKPLSLQVPKRQPVDHDSRAYFERTDPKVIEEIQRSHDGDMEPDFENLDLVYDEYQSEMADRKIKLDRVRMVRKHYRPLITKELNLLTYAEKEKIRYLHKSDPQEWTRETIASAFPISESGVDGIIRSGFRLTNPEDIKKHDERVVQVLKKIDSGEIPLSDQLREKLKVRNQMPITPGLSESAVSNLTTNKPLGAFGKLVAIPKLKSKAEANPIVSGNPNPVKLPLPHNMKTKELEEIYFDPSNSIDPDRQELQNLNINSNKRMTLSEFEGKIKHEQSRRGTEPSPSVDYLLKLKEKANLTDIIQTGGDDHTVGEVDKPSDAYFIEFEKIPKFKNYRGTNKAKMEFSVEKGQPYFYDPETGSQKPFAAPTAPDTISVPEEKRNSDAMYRVGDAYYDSNGEFLYRVV